MLIYAALQYGRPWFRYYLFKSDVTGMVRFPAQDAGTLKAEILEKAAKDHVPLSPENLSVSGRQWHFRAVASWSDSADIFGHYRRQFNFSFDENAEAP